MERRICKLCNKSFSNGRALGGHMRSHMLNLQTPPPPPPVPPPPPKPIQLSESTSSSSSSSSSSSEEEDKGLGYGLRENPKKSFRLVDPEFSFAVHDAGSSVVVQDRESETESSKNPSRRRSKRNRKSGFLSGLNEQHNQKKQEMLMMIMKKPKWTKLSKTVESVLAVELEPMSSVSDTSPEEDVALCLMMLSRGTWKREKQVEEAEEEDAEEEEEEEREKLIEELEDDDQEEEDEEDEQDELKITPTRNRGKYHCGTCKKVFKSYQALGGHRASHKKIKGCNTNTQSPSSGVRAVHENGSNAGVPNTKTVVSEHNQPKVHECPVCFRVFGSGQALGGHKRSHITGSAAAIANTDRNVTNYTKFGEHLIDLNLPAPMDDEDISQVEISAVSDAEFVVQIK